MFSVFHKVPKLNKICLISPNSPFLINPQTFPPLGLLSIAAFLREKGIEVEILDLAGLSKEEQKKRIDEVESDIAGITCVTPTYHEALKIRSWLKENNKIVIIGGPHATLMPLNCLDDGFDAVVIGDGEYASYAILREIEKLGTSKFLRKPMGIYSRYLTEQELGKLPLPARDLIDIHSYKYYLDGKGTTSMVSSLGCPYRCAFCSIIQKKVRFFPIERVRSEIEEIKNIGFDGLMIYDDIFTLHYGRFKEITDFISSEDMIYRCFVHVRLTNEKLVNQLAKTKCKEVGIGIESGNNEILRKMNKGFTAERALQAVKLLKSNDIRVKTFIIAGLPGESYQTINDTREWLRQAEPDDVDISLFSPLLGSDIYKQPENYDINIWNDKDDYDKAWWKGKPREYQASIATSYLSSEELVKLRVDLEGDFKQRGKLK